MFRFAKLMVCVGYVISTFVATLCLIIGYGPPRNTGLEIVGLSLTVFTILGIAIVPGVLSNTVWSDQKEIDQLKADLSQKIKELEIEKQNFLNKINQIKLPSN